MYMPGRSGPIHDYNSGCSIFHPDPEKPGQLHSPLVPLNYIRHYFLLRPGGEMEYRHWLPVVAAARISENIPEVEQWLLKQVEIIIE